MSLSLTIISLTDLHLFTERGEIYCDESFMSIFICLTLPVWAHNDKDQIVWLSDLVPPTILKNALGDCLSVYYMPGLPHRKIPLSK